MRTTSLALLILIPAVLCLTACEGLVRPRVPRWHHVERPKVEAAQIEQVQQSGEGARVEFLIALANPNDIPLPLVEVAYQVKIDGLPAVSLREVPNRTLPAAGMQTIRLAAAMPTGGRTVTGQSYSISGYIRYEPPGEIRQLLTDSYVPLPAVQFSGRGTLP